MGTKENSTPIFYLIITTMVCFFNAVLNKIPAHSVGTNYYVRPVTQRCPIQRTIFYFLSTLLICEWQTIATLMYGDRRRLSLITNFQYVDDNQPVLSGFGKHCHVRIDEHVSAPKLSSKQAYHNQLHNRSVLKDESRQARLYIR